MNATNSSAPTLLNSCVDTGMYLAIFAGILAIVSEILGASKCTNTNGLLHGLGRFMSALNKLSPSKV